MREEHLLSQVMSSNEQLDHLETQFSKNHSKLADTMDEKSLLETELLDLDKLYNQNEQCIQVAREAADEVEFWKQKVQEKDIEISKLKMK